MSSQAGTHEKDICTVKEIAQYLKISDSKIRQMIRRNAIPYAKIDGQYRFFLPTIREWLQSITISAATEVKASDAHATAHDIWNSSVGK